MTLAAICPGCGVMGGCICHTNAQRPRWSVPIEPEKSDLAISPSAAYAQGWCEGWLAAWQEAMKQKEGQSDA